MYQAHNETLFVFLFFFYDTETRPHFVTAAVWVGADNANKDQKPSDGINTQMLLYM